MAGDTHDFEVYKEVDQAQGRPTYHFVNGGGGAYLSIGTALALAEATSGDGCGVLPADRCGHRQAGQPDPAVEMAHLVLGEPAGRLAVFFRGAGLGV